MIGFHTDCLGDIRIVALLGGRVSEHQATNQKRSPIERSLAVQC